MKNYPYYEHQKLSNFSELLDYCCSKYGNKPVYSFHQDGELIRKSFYDFASDVRSLADYLSQNYKNKHLAVCGENSYNWLITFMAIVLSGNVCVAIDKDADESLLTQLLKSSDTDALFYSEKYLPFVSKMRIKKSRLEDTAQKLSTSVRNHLAPRSSAAKTQYSATALKLPGQDPDAPAVIFFTSGTTSAHKAVTLSQRNIMADLYGASSIYMPSGSTVSILPFHHSFGLVTAILMPAYYGVETYICSSLKRFTSAMQLIHPETIFLVPAFVEAFYRQIWRKARTGHKDKLLKISLGISQGLSRIGIDTSRIVGKSILQEFGGKLGHIICGGATLDPIYVKWFRKIGIEILNGYGITECSPVVSVNRNNYHLDGSIGVPCRDVEVKIINHEICVKGDIVMLGYFEDGKIIPQKGYFHTGDLGYINRGGFIFITGRIKDTIILSSGENISPEAIESEFRKFKGVREVIAYSEHDEINVMIYPEEDRIGDQAYFESLRKRYNRNKPTSHEVTRANLRTTEFIKNSSQKILRSKIFE